MPTYTFFNEQSGIEWDDIMSYAERTEFLEQNPHIKQVPPTKLNIVRGTSLSKSTRTDGGWNENLQRIAEAHPTSEIANQYGDKSAKAVKTRQAVEKWRKKRAADAL